MIKYKLETIEHSKLLLVEGKDELYFCDALLKKLGKHKEATVFSFDGKDRLYERLDAVIHHPEFSVIESLAIVRDADGSATSAFTSVTRTLRDCGLAQPPAVEQYAGSGPRIGIYLMPGSNRQGALENLCLDEIQDLPTFSCLETLLTCIDEKRPEQPIRNRSKALVQAFVATIPDPDVRVLGEAAKNNFLDFDHAAYSGLTAFLSGL